MAEEYPPLPPELIEFAEGGRSILIGTASAEHVPDCVRGVGSRVWPDGRRMTVIIPAVPGEVSIANLRANPRIAVTLSHIPSHRTMQLKGTVVAIRDGDEEALTLAIRYREVFAQDLAFVGMPPGQTLRLGVWPCVAVDFDIDQVFAQTPGPQAGVKLTAATRGAL